MLREAAVEATAYQRQIGLSQAQSAVADLTSKGMVVNEVSPAELERMRQVTKPVGDKFLTQYDPEVVKVYQAELAKVRKK